MALWGLACVWLGASLACFLKCSRNYTDYAGWLAVKWPAEHQEAGVLATSRAITAPYRGRPSLTAADPGMLMMVQPLRDAIHAAKPRGLVKRR